MSVAPDWDDVARFVSEYMAGQYRGAAAGKSAERHRHGLPASARAAAQRLHLTGIPTPLKVVPRVIQLVDSVL